MEDSPWSDLRQWLQQTRRRRGLSQEKMAALIGYTPNYIWRVEKGKRHPSKAFLQLLGYKMSLTGAEIARLEAFIQMIQDQHNGFERERERERGRERR